MRVVLAGGGTAGHVFPALALADHLRVGGIEVGFVGSSEGQEARLVPQSGYPFHQIRAQKMVRTLSIDTARAPFVALGSVKDVRPIIEGASAVVGLGGYVSAPAVIAARRLRIPIVLHEQNAVPGLANRLLSRIASAVGLSFEDAAARLPGAVRKVLTGNPVRSAIVKVSSRREALAAEAWNALDLDPTRGTVVVFGGSQGALRLDQLVVGASERLAARADLQLLVLTGPQHGDVLAPTVRGRSDLRVRALPYLDRIELALAVADLAVARAGAGHIAELTVCGVPSLLVPYPHATEHHQEVNAREVERAGAARVLLQDELSSERLANGILGLMDDEDARRSMSAAALAWAKPDAAERLAALVVEVAR